MKIKKYIARSFQAGKVQIMEELGEEAIVLSTKAVKGAGGEPLVEIVAAVDEKHVKESPTPERRPANDKLAEVAMAIAKKPTIIPPPKKQELIQAASIYEEMAEIKTILKALNDNVKYKYASSLGPDYGRLFRWMRECGFSEEYSLDIIGEVQTKVGITSFDIIIKEARHLLTENFLIAKPFEVTNQRQVIFFSGPTGSGKTTTLVKLAIISKLLNNAKVLILSTDTYKVGGAEQLSTYASVSGISFKAVYSPSDLKYVLNTEKDYNLIFVDTTGRSQKDYKSLKELREYIHAADPAKHYLVMNASVSESTAIDILDKFKSLDYTDVILSKLDETEKYGGIFSALNLAKVPISYLSYGQQVPEDIEPAHRSLIGKIVLPMPDTSPDYDEIFGKTK